MLTRYETFSSAISAIYHYIQKIERDEMIKYGSKGIFAQYLAALKSHPEGLTSAQLSDLCDKDKAAVSRALADMSACGLVTRTNRGDRVYRARLTLTEEGLRAADYVAERACAAVEAGGRGLSDEDRQTLYAALELIAGNLAVVSRDGIPDSEK